MNWAWEQSLPCSPKLILMALADAANDSGDCWPKVKTIARKCSVSERTVQRVIKEFVSDGLLDLTPRFNQEGRQISNKYRLLLCHRYPDKLSPSCSEEGGSMTPTSSSRASQLGRGQGGKAMSHQEPPIEPKNESSPAELRFHRSLQGPSLSRCLALLMGMDTTQAQHLLDELGRAIDRGVIRTTPEQWLKGVVQVRTAARVIQNTAASEQEYRKVLESKGLSPAVAAAIAAKTIKSRS